MILKTFMDVNMIEAGELAIGPESFKWSMMSAMLCEGIGTPVVLNLWSVDS